MRTHQPQFYRKVGVREIAQLVRPRLIPSRMLELPLESIYHYRPEGTATLGPSTQDPILAMISNRIFIEHVTELETKEGNPRRTVLNPTIMRNEYRRKTRGIRPLRKDDALLINKRSVLVVNYAMLNALYRYIQSFKTEYFRWTNINNTFWSNVLDIHKRFGWNQYIELHLPENIPTNEQFKLFSGSITQRTLSLFSTPAALNLADLWFWLGNERERSALSILSDEAIDKINFIVRARGYFFVINLGVINKWRLDKDIEDDTGLDGTVLQRRFVRLLHGLRDLMSGVTQVADTPTDGIKEGIDSTAPIKREEKLPEPKVGSNIDVEKAVKVTKSVDLLPDIDLTLPEPVTPPDMPTQEIPENIAWRTGSSVGEPKSDEDSSVLHVPNEAADSDIETVEEPNQVDRLTENIVQKAWDLHENGLMSAKALQRTLDESQTYKRLKDPYGSDQTLESMLEISQEDIELPDIPEFKNVDTIPDKSMLSSKLKGMQRKYINDVMRKDVVNAVMAIQQQGVVVKDYSVDVVQDAMNHREIHSVVVKPVRGRQTTIRFQLPVVDQEGRFVSNGITYKLRTQRSDIPIRKINPSRVALTSYYNKTFVDRAKRKINNFENWLTGVIVERGINNEDQRITELKFADVFDMSKDLPRIYTILAKRFSRFDAGEYHFFFDYNQRKEYFLNHSKVDVTKVEQPSQVALAVASNGDVLLIDGNNTLYRTTKGGMEVLGTITDLLDIDIQSAPLEVVEMSVSNKTLPVGFVLAYQFGLSNIIRELGCEVNRYRRGERYNPQPEEYTLVFQDEVLVFTRLDQRSTMILAGLRRFHQSLKQFSVWDFDQKDVYYRLMEDIGLGVRYLREIESLFHSWIDPITLGLLEQMGEPTTFKGLLYRSVDLLLSDFSPEEVDGAYMRYRGYERFAGIVYGELTRAAKLFNSRVSTGDAGVELNPLAVWQKIIQDPSKSMIEEANPIQDLREQEMMTYRGDGGRSGKSMVERTRVYHDSDIGVVSESTVDSGDVGVVAYLSPDPNFVNLRGVTRAFDKERDGVTKLLSTSALLAPASTNDDPKRMNNSQRDMRIVPLQSNLH